MPIRRHHRVPTIPRALRPALFGLVAGLCITGCSSQEKPSLTAHDPHAQNVSIANAVKTGDWTAVPVLIELLDSSDPAERLVAVGALRSITGEDHGFRIADPPALRGQAVDRWAAWWMEKDADSDASGTRTQADNDS